MPEKYEVTILYNGESTYVVEADNKEQAEQLARAQYVCGESDDIVGEESVERVVVKQLSA